MDINYRFPVVEGGLPKQPGQCFFSGQHEGRFIDTGHFIPGTGTVYIHETIVDEMYEALHGKPEPVIQEVYVPTNKETIDELVSDLRDAAIALGNIIAVVNSLASPTVEEEPDGDGGTTEADVEPRGEAVESDSKQGRANVLDASSGK